MHSQDQSPYREPYISQNIPGKNFVLHQKKPDCSDTIKSPILMTSSLDRRRQNGGILEICLKTFSLSTLKRPSPLPLRYSETGTSRNSDMNHCVKWIAN